MSCRRNVEAEGFAAEVVGESLASGAGEAVSDCRRHGEVSAGLGRCDLFGYADGEVGEQLTIVVSAEVAGASDQPNVSSGSGESLMPGAAWLQT
jgi:hypothetical protein